MRPSRDSVYLKIAELIATRGTCARRQVGCVLVDKRGRILATGYNGVASGRPHCSDVVMVDNPALVDGTGARRPAEHWEPVQVPHRPNACPGAGAASGQALDQCEAIHAEQNAILLLGNPYVVDTAYVTATPCTECMKLLLGTSCRRIVAGKYYPHGQALKWWSDAGRELVVLED